MNILHVTPTFFPAIFWGGPIFSTLALCQRLAAMPGTDLRVLTSDSAGPGRDERVPASGSTARLEPGFDVRYCRKRWGADFSPQLLARLPEAIRWADVVHLTAVYSPPTLPTLALCRAIGRPVVWSPRGSLQRWEGSSRQRAKGLWERACRGLLRPQRSVLHVTSPEEAKESAARMPGTPLSLIPNGVDLPADLPPRSWRPQGRLRALYLGRLHPKKGIDRLIDALGAVIGAGIDVHLDICGDGDPACKLALQEQAMRLGLGTRVSFHGEADAARKLRAFCEADVCVVPSHTENFGMVVAEALAHGVPVVASRGMPWAGLDDRQCGWWVPNTPDSLAQTLCRSAGADLAAMGARGRRWMAEEFSWEHAAGRMRSVYQELLRRD